MKFHLFQSAISISLLLAGSCLTRVNAAEIVEINEDLRIEPLAPGVWRHVSYQTVPGFGRAPANGMLLITEHAAVMVDTPWTDEQTAQLFDTVTERFGVPVSHLIATHFHADCMGGLAEAHRRGARSYALEMTAEFARRDGLPEPQHTFTGRHVLQIEGIELELRYFGGGHTRDNIVVWAPAARVLFGGCLVRRSGGGRGNLEDADVAAWPETVRQVLAAYPAAEIVIPGHGDPGGRDYLTYTIELFSRTERQQPVVEVPWAALRAPQGQMLGAVTRVMRVHHRGAATPQMALCRRNPLGGRGLRFECVVTRRPR